MNPTPTQRTGWAPPSMGVGALVGSVVVFAFVLAHNAFITDIWFNFVPMLGAGALIGLSLVWSYRSGAVRHSTGAWLGYAGVHVVEVVALGAVSFLVFRPRFTMAELLVAPDAFDQLISPSMPLIAAAIVAGTVAVWTFWGRRLQALGPILVTQVLVVFLLGHQFAFLGLVESETTLFVTAAGFVGITVVLAGVYGLGVMGSTVALERLRRSS